MKNFEYSGEELGTFKFAINWKLYYKKLIAKYFKDGLVIEVGAGIGEMTKLLKPLAPASKWICIEPDKKNANEILMLQSANEVDNLVQIFNGTLEEFNCESKIASVVMLVDSLEHIEDDFEAITKVSEILQNNGILIIIVPAHNFLFSDFDKKIGHFRRYNKKMIVNLAAKTGFNIKDMYYFNFVGAIGWFINFKILKRIGSNHDDDDVQVNFFDRFLVKPVKFIETYIRPPFGISLIAILEKK